MAQARPTVWAIVVAGGSGARFGGPKQDMLLGERRVIEWSLAAARAHADRVIAVVQGGRGDEPLADRTVTGGSTRAASVRAGLAAVDGSDDDIVLVHDAARPLAPDEVFRRVIAAVRAGADGAVPGVAVTDTIKVVDEHGVVGATPDRASLRAVQTPQGFRLGALRRAHAGAPDATDDAALVEAAGGRVVVVAGDVDNRKITTPADLAWARDRVAEVPR